LTQSVLRLMETLPSTCMRWNPIEVDCRCIN
jgi:hypothetical protein